MGEAIGNVAATLERLPTLVRDGERALDAIAGGVRLHPETMRELAGALREGQSANWPLWLAVLAIAAILAAAVLR